MTTPRHMPDPNADKKIVIPPEKVTKLIQIRQQLDAQIKEREAQAQQLKKRRTQAEQILSRYINRTNGEPRYHTDDASVHTSIHDFYSFIPRTGREDLNLWVLNPVKELVPPEVFDQVLQRLNLFKNEINKKFVDDYREENGAEKLSTGKNTCTLEGGALPDGVQMYREVKLNFRKTKSNEST